MSTNYLRRYFVGDKGSNIRRHLTNQILDKCQQTMLVGHYKDKSLNIRRVLIN